MSNYTWEYIQQHPQEVKRLLGISFEQLEQLIAQGKMLHRIKKESIEKQKTRISTPVFFCHPSSRFLWVSSVSI